jgi:hypothetical protein
MLIVGQRHLRRTLDNYARHYNGRRPHRALDPHPPRSNRRPNTRAGQTQAYPRRTHQRVRTSSIKAQLTTDDSVLDPRKVYRLGADRLLGRLPASAAAMSSWAWPNYPLVSDPATSMPAPCPGVVSGVTSQDRAPSSGP